MSKLKIYKRNDKRFFFYPSIEITTEFHRPSNYTSYIGYHATNVTVMITERGSKYVSTHHPHAGIISPSDYQDAYAKKHSMKKLCVGENYRVIREKTSQNQIEDLYYIYFAILCSANHGSMYMSSYIVSKDKNLSNYRDCHFCKRTVHMDDLHSGRHICKTCISACERLDITNVQNAAFCWRCNFLHDKKTGCQTPYCSANQNA